MEDLYRKDAVSKQELENATRGLRVAEAARKAVLAQLSYTDRESAVRWRDHGEEG
jgi:multidrug resistance efflux pump